jgi:hypothetical protein
MFLQGNRNVHYKVKERGCLENRNLMVDNINIVFVLLGVSPASGCNLPTFRNPLSVPSSKAVKY